MNYSAVVKNLVSEVRKSELKYKLICMDFCKLLNSPNM